jgi:hypothetical protein
VGVGPICPQGGIHVTLAYLDPASGSLIASALVGGVAAAGVAAKQARARLTGGFGRKRKQETEFSADTAENEAVDTADSAEAAAADDESTTDDAPADATAEKTTSVGSES